MRSARGDVREDHIVLHKKRPRTFVSGLASIAAVETSKHRLSRDFQRHSIFDFCNNIPQQRTFVSSCNSDRAAHARPDETAPGTSRWPTRSCWLRHVSGSAHPRIWYSSLADLTTRIDPYSVIFGSARRSEFQGKLACPLEGLRRVTRRERHGSSYVRKASASRGGKHR